MIQWPQEQRATDSCVTEPECARIAELHARETRFRVVHVPRASLLDVKRDRIDVVGVTDGVLCPKLILRMRERTGSSTVEPEANI